MHHAPAQLDYQPAARKTGLPTSHPATLDDYRLSGKTLLEKGEPLMAYDLLAEGLTQHPGDVRLRQLLALSLARSGASRRANQMLAELAAEGDADEETVGLLARTHKDLWGDATEEHERRRHLQLAFEHYGWAYRASGGSWSGINTATMALMLGDRTTARAVAAEVRERCVAISRSAAESGDRYWLLSMLGEAALILEEWDEAEAWYGEASIAGRQRWGDLASTRRNARLILRQLGADITLARRWLRIPPVVVFAGHLIDDPRRPVPRFPPSIEEAVRAAIREQLQTLGAGFGYASAACGGDILFLESLIELGGETRIVLPYNREEFLADSVAIVPGGNWTERYERLLGCAAEVLVGSTQPIPGGVSYEYAARLLDGMAAVRADDLDTELVCLAVWDGRPGDGPGGTASTVERWKAAGRDLHVIDLSRLAPSAPAERTIGSGPPPMAASRTDSLPAGTNTVAAEIVAMLFADARGFSKLSEREIPIFVDHFLGAVAHEIAGLPRAPILSNTWGDGFYFVFADVRDAAELALRLRDAVEGTDWVAKGFSHDLSLRIGLHAGPAYACLDPVTRRPNYFGVHVSRAARIEPITPPGEVYASGAFAALSRAAGTPDFTCHYVGQVSQAKGYGVFPTYVVQRRRWPM